ncbi:S1 family peptidase [Luteipulveratus mongoliensis]|uniref:Serine protease n=1 Tax=Luteipulveratus mongoliensis TaxID=571913 RepID=A0A0K1JIP6_9MICO|nr:S1 family peptidase [Luteipulveratus mongoliensis]AKU16576.1 serine protease [Luteipulveratus mongoliensis]
MRLNPSTIATAAASAGLLVTALATSPSAGAATHDPTPSTERSVNVPEMTARWLAQDRGISLTEARDQVAAQPGQTATADTLERSLGSSRSAGSYVDARGMLVVNVKDASAADAVRAKGATPRLVKRSGADLATIEQTVRRVLGTGFVSIGSEPVSNAVKVVVAGSDLAAAKAALADVSGALVRGTTAKVSTQANVYGGQQIEFSGYVCSLGFNARQGSTPVFVTAGHCGEGYQTFRKNGTTLGVTKAYSFPGNDYAYATLSSGWTGIGAVDLYNGTARSVKGSSNAAVGTAICKSGRTTGWTCGYVKAKNQQVNYGNGDVVSGLTLTNTCTEGGDSGGSWMAGSYAQGVTSGGASINGRCLEVYGRENVAYFQPIGEILSAYGLTLTTS